MAKKLHVENNDTVVSNIHDIVEKRERPITFVVVRAGIRVSDREYSSSDDDVAIQEKEFWNKVAQNHSYGEPVEIVQYDPRKHRVW